MIKILIDADGCPVVDNTIKIAKRYNIDVFILCDTSHNIIRENIKTITVSKGADSVDFKIVNMLNENDIVITQDYGLACMCLAKKAFAINQDGMIYDENNIDALLLFRHTSKKLRNQNIRLKGNKKRNKQIQDKKFEDNLILILEKLECKKIDKGSNI